jgi:hypothetical protein
MSRFVITSLAGIIFDDGVEKHRAGEHDQSRHAGAGAIAGVPKGIDVGGKRWSKSEADELASRKLAADKAFLQAYDKAEKANPSITADEARSIALKDPAFLSAKEKVNEHFLMQEAANLTSYKGTRMGDTYEPRNYDNPLVKLEHFSQFAGESANEEQGDRTLMKLTTQEGQTINGVPISGVSMTRQEALDTANKDWKEFMEQGEPQIIVSAATAQRIVSQKRVKTIHEQDRPARSGRSDDEYKDVRLVYENVAFGYDNNTPVEARPVSGLLGQGQPYYEYLDIYGGKNPAVIRLKPEVKERTTYTLGDSLNGFETPYPVSSPASRPWKYESAEAGVYRAATGRNFYTDSKMNAPEAQIHGGVNLSDIAGVTFYGTPSASVLGTMDRNNIPYTIETQTGRPTEND